MVPILTPFFHLFNSIGFSFYQLFLSVVGDLSVNGATFGKLGGSREAECWCESGMSSRKSGDGRWESSYLEVATLTLKSEAGRAINTLAIFFLDLVLTYLMMLEMAHPVHVGMNSELKLVNWLLQKLTKLTNLQLQI